MWCCCSIVVFVAPTIFSASLVILSCDCCTWLSSMWFLSVKQVQLMMRSSTDSDKRNLLLLIFRNYDTWLLIMGRHKKLRPGKFWVCLDSNFEFFSYRLATVQRREVLSPEQGLIPVKPRKATPGGHSTEPKRSKLHHSSDINGLIWVKKTFSMWQESRRKALKNFLGQLSTICTRLLKGRKAH